MNKNKWSIQIIIRYTLLQIPVIAVLVVLLILSYDSKAISTQIIWIILLIWLVKDIILYPFVWRAYDPEYQKHDNPLIGQTGIAQENLNPSGYIKLNGELWRAKAIGENETIAKGEGIIVREVRGLTLLVASDEPHD